MEDLDLLKYEKELYKEGYELIAGTDEAGRGPLCGPVVAAAVILTKNYKLEGLNDSKQLSEKKRDKYFEIIKKDAISYGISIVDAKTIDEINIYEASRKAMLEAISKLDVTPDFVLTDAMPLPMDNSKAIIHGDALSLSIAAASVLAKVTRDEIMYELDKKYPEYGFKSHKGYPTKKHLENIKKYGILDNYRLTYKPVKALMEEKNERNSYTFSRHTNAGTERIRVFTHGEPRNTHHLHYRFRPIRIRQLQGQCAGLPAETNQLCRFPTIGEQSDAMVRTETKSRKQTGRRS